MYMHTNTKNISINQTKKVKLFFSLKPGNLQPHPHHIKHSTPIILNIGVHIKHTPSY
jgi:hypothetical protein